MPKTAPKSRKKVTVSKTTSAVPEANGNIGELIHKLINPGELEVKVPIGEITETLVLRPLGYLDKIALDTHLDYMSRECGTVGEISRTSALMVTQMVGTVYFALHKKLSDGRFIRRFMKMEDIEKLNIQHTKELHKLYQDHFKLSLAAKKE